MNAKKAKALRRLAREAFAGRPMVAYQGIKPNKKEIGPNGKTRTFVYTGSLVLKPNCIRGVYQLMKKDPAFVASIVQAMHAERAEKLAA